MTGISKRMVDTEKGLIISIIALFVLFVAYWLMSLIPPPPFPDPREDIQKFKSDCLRSGGMIIYSYHHVNDISCLEGK